MREVSGSGPGCQSGYRTYLTVSSIFEIILVWFCGLGLTI